MIVYNSLKQSTHFWDIVEFEFQLDLIKFNSWIFDSLTSYYMSK